MTLRRRKNKNLFNVNYFPILAYPAINKMYEISSGWMQSKKMPTNAWIDIDLSKSDDNRYGIYVDDYRQM